MTDVVRRLGAVDRSVPAESWIGTAEVTDATAGTTTDGRLLIEIAWNGTTATCAYLDHYTPASGDLVTFLKNGPSVIVLGRPARA